MPSETVTAAPPSTCGALRAGDPRPCKLDPDHEGLDHFNGMDLWPDGSCVRPVTEFSFEVREHASADGPDSSRQAAAQIAPDAKGCVAAVLTMLLANRGEWVSGYDLIAVGGNEGLRRKRDLKKLGYVVEGRRPPGKKGVWEYRIA